MSLLYNNALQLLSSSQRTWLITGVAGFIGSHLLGLLLKYNQFVIGIDNFSTGSRENLEEVLADNPRYKVNFLLKEGDIRDYEFCVDNFQNVDYVLHHAALASVPESLRDPREAHTNNIEGTMNILMAARQVKVKKIIYASSSAVYGENKHPCQQEHQKLRPISPYAVTKAANELYVNCFSRSYDLPAIGFRYFNIFGPRQYPQGAYGGVIATWVHNLAQGKLCEIYGEGTSTRDFCYVDNVAQANILGALLPQRNMHYLFNIGSGKSCTLNELLYQLCSIYEIDPADNLKYCQARIGDIKYSSASIAKAVRILGYTPSVELNEGLRNTVNWVQKRAKSTHTELLLS